MLRKIPEDPTDVYIHITIFIHVFLQQVFLKALMQANCHAKLTESSDEQHRHSQYQEKKE